MAQRFIFKEDPKNLIIPISFPKVAHDAFEAISQIEELHEEYSQYKHVCINLLQCKRNIFLKTDLDFIQKAFPNHNVIMRTHNIEILPKCHN
jgi:hypothetical protein